MRNACSHSGRGFTLVEIAIVLVIIALVTGGIVVGRDMIRLAQIRAQITQFESYNIAVNTFQSRYAAYPGDIAAFDAEANGFVTRGGDDGSGDGDGVIEGCMPHTNYDLGCEAVLFWRDLSDAKLIQDAFHTATDSDPVFTTSEQGRLYYPSAKLDANKLIVVGADQEKRTWYVLLKGLYINPPFAGFSWGSTPEEAYSIDTKMDDGLPLSGVFMIGWPNGAPPAAFFGTPVQGTGYCVYNDQYNLAYKQEYCLPLAKMQTGL